MSRIEGKTVVITGATAGIGEACAWTLADRGARLVLIGRRADRLEALVSALRERSGAAPYSYTLDVRDRSGVDDFAGWLDAEGIEVYGLVNNAGLARGLDTLQEGSHEDWDEMIDTNVKGVLNMTRALLPGMIRRDSGHVVNIGSIAGHIVYPKGNVYNATKYAVRALTEAGNLDLVGTKVRMSSVDPGLVETEFSVVRFRGDEPRAKAVYEGLDTLLPEDVADAVGYVMNTPPHVNVVHLIMMSADQRSPYVMSRRD